MMRILTGNGVTKRMLVPGLALVLAVTAGEVGAQAATQADSMRLLERERAAGARREQAAVQLDTVRFLPDGRAVVVRRAGAVVQLRSEDTGSCPNEELSLRRTALLALAENEAASMDVVETILFSTDDDPCRISMQTTAATLLIRWNSDRSRQMLIRVLESDAGTPQLRNSTRMMLVRSPQGFAALLHMARTHDDPDVWRPAFAALRTSNRAEATPELRRVANDPALSTERRIAAIFALPTHREENIAFLVEFFGSQQDEELRRATFNLLSRGTSAEHFNFFRRTATDSATPMELRVIAVRLLGRSGREEDRVALEQMFRASNPRELREAAFNAINLHSSDASLDFLIHVARTEEDPALRRVAVTYLSRRNDPRAQEVLREIARGGGGTP